MAGVEVLPIAQVVLAVMSIKEASRSCDLTGDNVLVITFIQQAKPKYKRGSIDDRNERERERERERRDERE